MTQDMFVDAVGMIDFELLENYACMENRIKLQKQRHRRASWKKLLIAAAAIVLTLSLLLVSMPIVYIVNYEQINHYVTQTVDQVLFPLESDDGESSDVNKEDLQLDWTEWEIAGAFFAALGAGKEGSVMDQLQAGSGGLFGELGMDLGKFLEKLYEYYQKYSDQIPKDNKDTTPTDPPIQEETNDTEKLPTESETEFEYLKINDAYQITGIISHKGDTVVVPSEYQGLPVISVRSSDHNAWNLSSEVHTIVLPKSVTTIEAATFANCIYIQRVIMPGVTLIEQDAFLGCISLAKVDMPVIQAIEQNAFRQCTGLEEIDLQSCLELGEFAFTECTSLIRVYGVNLQKAKGASFKGCTFLRVADFPNLVSLGSSTFQDCVSLESITFGETLTGIGTSAFHGCTALTDITIPKSVTSLGNNIFMGCKSLQKVVLKYDIQGLPNGMFDGCTALEAVYTKEPILRIGTFALRDCSSLKEINIGPIQSIGSGAFRGCSGVTEIDLTGCLSLTGVPDSMFYNCTDLKTLKLPHTVKSIHYNALANCNSLEKIVFGGTMADWNHLTLSPNLPKGVKVICADGTIKN